MIRLPDFEWSDTKNRENSRKHGIAFEIAQYAFNDPCRIIAIDHQHSSPHEQRYFCYGRIDDHVVTVRFTMRERTIRIFGAGIWRSGRRIYHEKNKIFRRPARH